MQADADDPGVAAAAAADRKRIDPLPPVDHDSIAYDDFAKDFYEEPPGVAALTPAEAGRPASAGSWHSCMAKAPSRRVSWEHLAVSSTLQHA